MTDADVIAAHLAATAPGGPPPLSLRYIHEPCAKHAEKPPGEQTWLEGSPVDPVTGLQEKKRDPNGYDHTCPDCLANAEIRLEA